MNQRLKDVVAKLYRSPANRVRQVFALSRAEAERLPRLSFVAVISITAPERPLARVEGFDHLLRLSFADVDFLSPSLSRKAKEKVVYAFTPEQARLVNAFLDMLPDEVSAIVIHCEGGYSRSCAIALALHQLRGYRVEMERLSEANPFVVSVMMQTKSDIR